jgi:hypothetical protein
VERRDIVPRDAPEVADTGVDGSPALDPGKWQRAYTDRLNALFTPAGWTRRYTIYTSANFERRKDQKIIAKVTCELTIFGLGSHSATGEEWADDDNAGTSAETLGFRHIGVVHDEYAVSPDGMKAFGVLDLETEMEGCRFSIGLRNSHDKSMRLAMTCGYRVFVCSNMAFAGDFTPVLAKHSKSFSLIDCISVGVDRMQRNFEPMRKQVEAWQRSELTDVTAKVVIYEAFVECKLEAPKHLARTVHELYFEPKYEEFRPFKRVYVCIQRTRSYPTIQGHGQAGGIPRRPVLPGVLVHGGGLGWPPLPS